MLISWAGSQHLRFCVCSPCAAQWSDVVSLGLDLLVRQYDYRRGSINPFLLGY